MAEETPLYFGLEDYEYFESKKNLLSSEMLLLNIMKTIRRYNLLRAEEFKIKFQIHKAVKGLDLAIKKTKSSFPFLKIPQITKKEESRKKEITITKEKFDEDLEYQLKDIQEKLKAIEG